MQMKTTSSRRQAGLTLIEMITVIAIIIILILIGWMAWRNQFNKAKDANRKDDLQRLSIAFEEYFTDHDCYPPADILSNCGGNELSPYLNSIPCDPLSNTKYCYIPDDTPPGTCPRYYRLLSSLDNTTDPIITKLQCHGPEYCGYETECDADVIQNSYNYGVSSLNVPVLNPEVSPPPDSSPGPGDSPTPSPEGNFACHPGIDPETGELVGICNSTADPEGDGCPQTFSDPFVCQAACASPDNWCEK